MHTHIETMTPERAATILAEKNNGNRSLRKNHVEKFVGILKRGEWKTTSQGASFSRAGRLLNGQHRLAAIVESGITVDIAVTYNEPEENFAVLDSDLISRRAIDYLGVSARVAEIAKLTAAINYPSSFRRTVESTKRMHAVFGEAAGIVSAACPSYKRTVTSAPVRAAAALRVAMGQGDYVLPLFKKVTSLEMDGTLPPVAQAFIKQAFDENNITANNRMDFLVRAWITFDETKQNNTKLLVRDQNATIAEIRTVIRSLEQAKFGDEVYPESRLIKQAAAPQAA